MDQFRHLWRRLLAPLLCLVIGLQVVGGGRALVWADPLDRLEADLLVLCVGSESDRDGAPADRKHPHDLSCCLTQCRADLSWAPSLAVQPVVWHETTGLAYDYLPPSVPQLDGRAARSAHRSRAPPHA